MTSRQPAKAGTAKQPQAPPSPPAAPAAAGPKAEQTARDFELERYKFILQQINALNDNLHKYLSLFQTLAAAIVGAGVSLFVGYPTLKISPDVARAGIYGLLWLLTILGAFAALSVVAGLVSWFDYRKEECALLDELVRKGFRQPPRLGNFWRWYETYVLLFIVGAVAFVWIYTANNIIPLIK